MLPATPPILITTLNGIGLGGFKIKGKFQVSKITTGTGGPFNFNLS